MVHCFHNNGYHIVLDVNSGAVHVTDELVAELIPHTERLLTKMFGSAAPERDGGRQLTAKDREDLADALMKEEGITGRFLREDIGEALEDILDLRDMGELFTPDIYEDTVEEFNDRDVTVKALCLNVAHDCNLRCRYCFADEGEYHGKRALMSFETGRAALDFLVRSSGTRRNLEVDFFGGEPLMNWEVVKEIVAYGRSIEEEAGKRFRFTLTTNGLLLDERKLSFINEEMDNLVLSIDGRKTVHDRMRPDAGGRGSYDRVLPALLRAASYRGELDHYVRGTYTRHNLDFAKDVEHLADLGFTQISVEPVVAPSDADYSLRREDIPVLEAQYDELAKFVIERRREGRPFRFFHFNIDLDGGPCVQKRLSGCGSGCDYLGVTPFGELYPCHQFVGNPDFVMGSVYEGVTRTDIRDSFRACSVYSRAECRECFAKYYCSGGCAANAYQFTGSVNGVYDIGCALQKKRIECAIMIKAEEQLS